MTRNRRLAQKGQEAMQERRQQTPTSRISAKLLDQILMGIRKRLESGEIIRKALCEQAGISTSYLSRILSEGLANRTIPSRTLKQIVAALEPEGLSGFIRKSQRILFCIRRRGDAPEVIRELFPDCTAVDLSRGFVGRTMFPFLLTKFSAEGKLPTPAYFLPSERFLYVLHGELKLHTSSSDTPMKLQAGDAVYIPEFLSHSITAQSDSAKAVTILWDLQGVRPQALYTRGGMRLSYKSKQQANGEDRNTEDRESEYWRMVGLRIQALRTRCGLTQELLAQLSGLPESELRQIESGRRAPSLDKLLIIASMLRVSDLSDLLTDHRAPSLLRRKKSIDAEFQGIHQEINRIFQDERERNRLIKEGGKWPSAAALKVIQRTAHRGDFDRWAQDEPLPYVYVDLAKDYHTKRIVPMITRFGRRNKSAVVRVAHAGERSVESDGEIALSHGDEEFFMVLDGAIGCKLGADEDMLNESDCLHFRSNLPHGFWSDTPVEYSEALHVMWTYSGKSVLFSMPNGGATKSN
ncbi:MAG TPA: helix-turn-helix domain-containing protein [Terriglobia bacterium]|nr:helix-turn-helix domain-containing protein [Terriglobia bacterium]